MFSKLSSRVQTGHADVVTRQPAVQGGGTRGCSSCLQLWCRARLLTRPPRPPPPAAQPANEFGYDNKCMDKEFTMKVRGSSCACPPCRKQGLLPGAWLGFAGAAGQRRQPAWRQRSVIGSVAAACGSSVRCMGPAAARMGLHACAGPAQALILDTTAAPPDPLPHDQTHQTRSFLTPLLPPPAPPPSGHRGDARLLHGAQERPPRQQRGAQPHLSARAQQHL